MFKIAFFLNGDTAINCQLQLVPLVGATAIPDTTKKKSNGCTAEQFRQLNCIQGMLSFMHKSKFMFTFTFFKNRFIIYLIGISCLILWHLIIDWQWINIVYLLNCRLNCYSMDLMKIIIHRANHATAAFSNNACCFQMNIFCCCCCWRMTSQRFVTISSKVITHPL